jgi:hypothetical protein
MSDGPEPVPRVLPLHPHGVVDKGTQLPNPNSCRPRRHRCVRSRGDSPRMARLGRVGPCRADRHVHGALRGPVLDPQSMAPRAPLPPRGSPLAVPLRLLHGSVRAPRHRLYAAQHASDRQALFGPGPWPLLPRRPHSTDSHERHLRIAWPRRVSGPPCARRPERL